MVQLLDPETIASLDDARLGMILRELADPRLNLDRDARESARAAAARFLEAIM